MKLTLVILNVVAAVALVLLGSFAVAAHRTHAYSVYRELKTQNVLVERPDYDVERRIRTVAAGGTSIGFKGMMVAAKTLALTAIDMFESPDVIAESWKELKKRRGDNFVYEALLGDRKPALNYRD